MTGESKPFSDFSDQRKALTERLDVNFALKAARLGVWELDPVTNLINWDDRCRELFGLVTDNLLSYEQATRHIHPDDVARVDAAVQWAMNPESGGGYDVTYRTIGADDGRLRWVRFTGQSYFNDSAEVYRFAGVAQDVTQDVQVTRQIAESEIKFRSLVEEAPVATGLFVGRELRIEVANQPMQDLWGKGNTVMGKPLTEALPELEGQPFLQILNDVYTTGQTYQVTAAPCNLVRNGQLGTYYFDFTYKPLRNAAGEVYAIMDMATEVTEQVSAQKKLQESEVYFRQLTDTTPAIIWMTEPDGYCTYLNKRWYAYTGQTQAEAEGFGWLSATHPDDQAEAGRLFVEANEQRAEFNVLYRLRHKGGQYRWAIDKGSPRFSADGTYQGMIGTVVEVHDQIVTRQKLEASETSLRSIVTTAPAAMGLFVGRDLLIEMPNQAFIDIVGKGPNIVGRPLREVMPELESQAFLQILDDVYTSGKMFQSYGAQVDIVQHGVMSHNYYNITYSPLFDAEGKVYAILDIAIDVTGEVRARQKLEEAEAALRGAIDLAELAIWSLDVPTGRFSYSPRFMHWLGFSDETKLMDEAYNPLPDEYRQSVADAIADAIRPGSSGFYENEHPIINQLTGQVRVIHAQAQVVYDAAGQPAVLSGTAQDVTEQRKIQVALEQQVQQRTEELAAINEELEASNEELAATNEELAAANEELTATNEELIESTQLLVRSNENLQRFAYVASHDLQEPLRKIQQFGDLLKDRYGTELGEGTDYLARMQSAASRMSTLIRDLLTFSRISTQRDSSATVAIGDVVQAVANDLDLRIQETGAVIDVGPLPVVEGDVSQLHQLFQNLIGNALKFRRPDVEPLIWINAQRLTAADLPASVRPTRAAKMYDRIDVSDNGIGFDEKYVDRIFQVFQRLHGVNQYAGTGIGLAICEKVATNHGGAITATSQPGQGATFSVYLPAM